MSDGTEIAWTDATWNPLVGCSRVSAGCEHCYAERLVHRGLSPQHRGLTRATSRGPVWTGEVRLVEKALDLPLRWRKPRLVFVNSLSDLFHESVPDETIDRVFAVMALALHPKCGHTFQLLTKRAERMRAYVSAPDVAERVACETATFGKVNGRPCPRPPFVPSHLRPRWPLPNVWLGVSCEDQAAADERIPLLLATPAEVRFVSAEPLLGPIDAADYLDPVCDCEVGQKDHDESCPAGGPRLDWIIAGGESGPGARPCDVAWIRSIVEKCKTASVPVFVKQLGAKPSSTADRISHRGNKSKLADGFYRFLNNRKGADPAEWPEDLRVQEVPR